MEQNETASTPVSKKRRRAPPLTAALAGGADPAHSARVRGRRRESGTGDEDDGEIDEMLVALGIPNSDKKKKQHQREAQSAEVIELITPPRTSSRAPAARSGARNVVSFDDDDVSESAKAADDGARRRESIVDLTSPDATAIMESVSVVISSGTYTPAEALPGETMQRARRTILVATSEDEAHELQLPTSPVIVAERTAPVSLPSPQTPSSDRECDAMLEDLMLTRPLAERISAARGRDGNTRSTASAAIAGADRDNHQTEQIGTRQEDRELTLAQGGGFLYSNITIATRATVDRRNQGPTKPMTSVTSLFETLDFRMSESRYTESVIPSIPAASEAYEGPVGPVDVRPEAVGGTLQKKARASKASGSKREPIVAVVKMERTLNDSEAGQVLKKALQTHVYNNKPLVFELGAAFDCMHSNVIQWERRETVVDRSKTAGGVTPSARNAASSSAPSVCRFLSVALYFQAEEFIQLLEQESYSEVQSIMQYLKKDLQVQAARLLQRQSRFLVDGCESGEIQLSSFLIIEGMDKCLINRKKKKQTTSITTTTTAQPTVQVSQLSFNDIHEMAFQLFMDTETHTKVSFLAQASLETAFTPLIFLILAIL